MFVLLLSEIDEPLPPNCLFSALAEPPAFPLCTPICVCVSVIYLHTYFTCPYKIYVHAYLKIYESFYFGKTF